MVNLYDKPDSAEVVARLKAEMKRLQQQYDDQLDSGWDAVSIPDISEW